MSAERVRKRAVAARGAEVAVPVSARAGAEPDRRAAQRLVLELLALPGVSGQEKPVVDYIRERLLAAGAPPAALACDQAQRRSPFRGQQGYLVLRLPGTCAGPRRLLMAHVDTVPICQGARPVLNDRWIVPADKRTGLGADDRAGAAVVLSAALHVLRRRLPHPPLCFLWTVQEEVGLYGARHLGLKMLGKPQLAFNFDGGPADRVTVGATGGYRMTITVRGTASHAGAAPEKGVSAIAIAALAIAQLQLEGWHGRIEKNGHSGTANVGVIRGGQATNVVTPEVEIHAEARSHDPAFRRRIVRAIQRAFRQAARSVRNVRGVGGKVHIVGRLDYESFVLPPEEPCVLAAEAAIRSVGAQPGRRVSNGGLDANWMTARGVPTVTLGCGQVNAHTTQERLDLRQFELACRIALRLASDLSSPPW
jgi:tripeptide aminopeptidase